MGISDYGKLGDLQYNYVRAVGNQVIQLQQLFYEVQRTSIMEGAGLPQPIGEWVAVARTFTKTLKSLGTSRYKQEIANIERNLHTLSQTLSEGEIERALSLTDKLMDDFMKLLEAMNITKVLFYRPDYDKQTKEYLERYDV